jgi:DNA invertase Pin-like site-specific DNA recombinase
MNNSASNSKITDGHRAKLAYVYVRQSTVWQVDHNTESTTRQYELKDRAADLGWPIANIKIIDQDLGKSGARSDERHGFQQLLAEIGLGQVGIVLSLEAARLARNCSDWYRMLELCSIFGTVIADYELVYDPQLYHDRLLLGLAGMMSEAELHHIRMRMTEGQRHKAERGELWLPMPVGLERLPNERVLNLNDDDQLKFPWRHNEIFATDRIRLRRNITS